MSRIAWYTAVGATIALVISISALMSASDSQAIVTFTVNSTADEPDAANDGICASAGSGLCTLRAAIQQTNQMPGMDIVDVPAGVYTLEIAGASEDNSATGDLDILDDVKIDGASGIATIDGNEIDRVFDIDPNNEDLDVQIDDVRIQNGRSVDGEDGGGLFSGNPDGILQLATVFFENNDAIGDEGGGMYNASQVSMVDVEFHDNLADFGGGLYQDALTNAGLTGILFFRNRAQEDGGGLYLEDGPTTMIDAEFSENRAAMRGGAAFVEDVLTITDGTLSNNTVESLTDSIAGAPVVREGGAFYNASTGDVTITNVTMADNVADFGGAIYNTNDFLIMDTTLMSNFADIDGGAILNSGLGIMTINNSTVSGNEAREHGGGIANYGDFVQMNNVTITLNTADFDQTGDGEGGGVYNVSTPGADVVISNTIIGKNNFPISSFDCWGTLLSAGYNLIGDTTGCFIGGNTTGNVLNQNPALVDLANNGGDTLTHLPTAFSPAVDAGNPASIAGGSIACEPIDQRGVTRPRDGNSDNDPICDIGAVEVQGGGPSATPFGTATPTSTPGPSTTATPAVTATPTTSVTPIPTATPEGFEIIWADANCSDAVDPTDSLVVLRADAGFNSSQEDPCVIMGDTATFDDEERIWGDYDCSGSMSPVDSLKILQFDAGFQPAQTGQSCPDFGSTVTVS